MDRSGHVLTDLSLEESVNDVVSWCSVDIKLGKLLEVRCDSSEGQGLYEVVAGNPFDDPVALEAREPACHCIGRWQDTLAHASGHDSHWFGTVIFKLE